MNTLDNIKDINSIIFINKYLINTTNSKLLLFY